MHFFIIDKCIVNEIERKLSTSPDFIRTENKKLVNKSEVVIFFRGDKKIGLYVIKEIKTKNPKYEIKLKLELKKVLSKFTQEDFDYLIKIFFQEKKNNFLYEDSKVGYISEEYMIITDVLYFLKKIKSYSSFEKKNLYRGQRDARWKILPSIHRKRKIEFGLNNKENEIYMDIRKNNFPEFRKQDEFLNEVIHMQHYGIPTPLTDWTRNPLMALFFASQSSADGKVFISSTPNIINFSSSDYNEISELLEKIYKGQVEKINSQDIKRILGEEQYFLETINENNRITVQRGLFSIYTKPYRLYEFFQNHIIQELVEEISNITSRKSERDKEKYKDILVSMFKFFRDEVERIEEHLNNSKDKIIEYLKMLENILEQEEKKKKEIYDLLSNKFKNIAFEQKKTENAIIILAKDKENIKKELDNLLGINALTVYPDYIGYIDYINENFS